MTHVGSHDTASAVVAVPAGGAALRLHRVRDVVARRRRARRRRSSPRRAGAANFTNEAGVDGRVRYLRNVMGLWLLQESLRTWERAGQPEDLRAAAVAGRRRCRPAARSSTPTRRCSCRRATCRRGSRTPAARPVSRAAVDAGRDSSAASSTASPRPIARAVRRRGPPVGPIDVDVVHLVGGGARNELLCQLTADACGLPVVAGPVEATALGNVLVQARARGLVAGDLEALRALVRATHHLRRYEPASPRTRRRGALVG